MAGSRIGGAGRNFFVRGDQKPSTERIIAVFRTTEPVQMFNGRFFSIFSTSFIATAKCTRKSLVTIPAAIQANGFAPEEQQYAQWK